MVNNERLKAFEKKTPKRTKGIRDKRAAKEWNTKKCAYRTTTQALAAITGTNSNHRHQPCVCARPTVCIIVALAALSLCSTCCERFGCVGCCFRMNVEERTKEQQTHTDTITKYVERPVYGSQFMVFFNCVYYGIAWAIDAVRKANMWEPTADNKYAW